jgi:hypothetical protein
MAKTIQCMKVNVLGAAYVCTFTPGRCNPYQLYRTWYDMGNHRKRIAEYANFESVLLHMVQMNIPEFKRDYFANMA